jgi:HAMP domain-containing protein
MGLRIKILSGFLILAIMLCVAGAWSIYELRSIGTSVQRLLDDNYKSINAAKTMIEALEREDSGVLLLLLGRRKEGRSIIEVAETSFKRELQIAEGNITIPGEKALVDEVKSKYSAYKSKWTKPIVGTAQERNIDWYFNEVHNNFLEVKTSLERLMTMNDQTMYNTASDLKNRAHRAVMPGIVAILSALIFTVIFNYIINYYMVSPIIALAEGIDKFLKYRMPFEVNIESKDELRHLANSIRELSSKVKVGEEKE